MKKIILLAFAFLAQQTASAQMCFGSTNKYSNPGVASNAFGICKGDFNGDGWIDLAVCNDATSNITIFFNGPGGVLTTGGVYNTGTTPNGIVSADFNGDGKLDLATANNGAGNCSVLMNNGTGGFPSATNLSTGGPTKAIITADLNGDSKADLAVACPNTNTISWFIGDGAGNFTLGGNSSTVISPYGINVTDVNNDGFKDLVTISNTSGDVGVHLGNGSTFSFTNVPTGLGAGYFSVLPIDYDQDNKMDLVCGGNGSGVDFLQGDGTGGFVNTFGSPTNSQPRCVAFIDYDGDGDKDLVTANYGSGDLSFVTQGPSGMTANPSTLFVGGNPRWVLSGDFNNDGNEDIAGANNGTNEVFLILCTRPHITVSGNTSLCLGQTATLTATGTDSYTWTPGPANTSTVSLTPTSTSTIVVTGNTAMCPPVTASTTVVVTINPQPTVTPVANPTSICLGGSLILSGSGAQTYTWSNGVIDGVSFTPSGPATYTVIGSDASGCKDTATITVGPAVPTTPNICMVTVDSLSVNNLIIWDKTLYPAADTFLIYRDTANNNFIVVGKVPYASLSQFADTDRLISHVTGDPNITTYRYKLAYIDTCGNTSPLSPYHNTIYHYNSGSLFLWNAYQIEGQITPVPGLSQYQLRRDNLGGTGNYVTAATAGASSTQINDPQYALYQSTADWRVETVWSIACTPTARQSNGTQGTVVKSKSNISNNRTTNITKILSNLVSVFPNPTNGKIQVKFNSNVIGTITLKVYSSLGAEVLSISLINPSEGVPVDLSNFEAGIYMLQLVTDAGSATKRIIKN